jgi:hypothetical protein
MPKPTQKSNVPTPVYVCSNCGAPFHGLTTCPENAPRFIEARDKASHALLVRAAELQTEFWYALRKLESAVGFDIDDTADLANETIEHLRETAGKEN